MDPLIPLPASPCIRTCCLDDDEVCLGCGRHLSEIVGWQQATAERREVILALAAVRRARRQDWLRRAAGAGSRPEGEGG